MNKGRADWRRGPSTDHCAAGQGGGICLTRKTIRQGRGERKGAQIQKNRGTGREIKEKQGKSIDRQKIPILKKKKKKKIESQKTNRLEVSCQKGAALVILNRTGEFTSKPRQGLGSTKQERGKKWGKKK